MINDMFIDLDNDSLNQLKMDNKEDIVEGICPVGITLLYAQQKTGKSFVALDLAVSVASKKNWLKYNIAKNGNVLYLAFDDTKRTIVNRFEKHSLKRLKIATYDKYIEVIKTKEFNGYNSMGKLNHFIELFIKKYGQVSMVVVDTFQKTRGNITEISYSSEVLELNTLKMQSQKYGYNILLVHHEKKGNNDNNVFQSSYGTNGLGAESDVLIRLGRINMTSKTVDITGNNIPTERYVITQDNNGSFTLSEDKDDLIPDNPDKTYLSVIKFMYNSLNNKKSFEWKGSAQELVATLDLDIDPRRLGRILTIYEKDLEENNIKSHITRNNNLRMIKLKVSNPQFINIENADKEVIKNSKNGKRIEIKNKIIELIKKGVTDSKEIEEYILNHGYSQKTFYRARAELKKENIIDIVINRHENGVNSQYDLI